MINDGLVMLKANVRSCSHTIKVRTQLYIDLAFVMNDVFLEPDFKISIKLSLRRTLVLYKKTLQTKKQLPQK